MRRRKVVKEEGDEVQRILDVFLLYSLDYGMHINPTSRARKHSWRKYSPEGCITKESRSQHPAACVVADLAWERAAPQTASRNLNGLGTLADVMSVETIQTSLWDMPAVRPNCG